MNDNLKRLLKKRARKGDAKAARAIRKRTPPPPSLDDLRKRARNAKTETGVNRALASLRNRGDAEGLLGFAESTTERRARYRALMELSTIARPEHRNLIPRISAIEGVQGAVDQVLYALTPRSEPTPEPASEADVERVVTTWPSLPPAYAAFLREIPRNGFACTWEIGHLTVFGAGNLEQGQQGYDIGERVVLASAEGDPIAFDPTDGKLYEAAHGRAHWDFQEHDTLAGFLARVRRRKRL